MTDLFEGQTQTNSFQSQSHIATDGQSVNNSWCRAPSGAHDQIFIAVWQLQSCLRGAPYLTRGWTCILYMLLALSSAVFFGFESLGIRDHILLSQIWDFPFRRLLRLAGSRWRYSNPPPHGCCWSWSFITSSRTLLCSESSVVLSSPGKRVCFWAVLMKRPTVIAFPWKFPYGFTECDSILIVVLWMGQ
jgi:hypothetical protein